MDPITLSLYQYYLGWFIALLVVLYAIRLVSRSWLKDAEDSQKQGISVTKAFTDFQRIYVIVYLLMMAADWLQGPYVYALYKHYGFSQAEIGKLFIAGFGSSLLFGTIAGSTADKYGRKALCIVFGILYSLSCITKHSPDYRVLMVGRVLGGISTSILFSAFESWMVHEHHSACYPEEWLSLTFSIATSGNGVVAILSGIVGQFAADNLGPVAPFDLSMAFLIIGTLIVVSKWNENFGDARIGIASTLSNAWERLCEDPKIMLLGIIQSLFEGAMYIFVFMWTPALETTSPYEIYHGWIFASLMICVLIGSTIFNTLIKLGMRVERFSVNVFAAAACSLFLPAMILNHTVRLLCFFAFEICCGMFWPCLGTMRGRYVPEEVRATTMNFFRVPLNLIVVIVLANIGKLSESHVFLFCACCLVATMVAQVALKNLTVDGADIGKKENANAPVSGDDDDAESAELVPTAADSSSKPTETV